MQKRMVILAPNWLGDAVMALPAIGAVRRGMPDATIVVAARPSIAPLFALVPSVDDTVVLDRSAMRPIDPTSWRRRALALAAGAFDVALLLPNSMHAALMAAAARIPERWGFRTQWRAPLLTRSIVPPGRLHQVEYYRALVAALGFPGSDDGPRVRVSDDIGRRGAALLVASGWTFGAPLVAIAPGAAYGGAKRWPPERFAELASSLAGDGVQTVMIGTTADAPTAARVGQRFVGAPRSILNLVGQTDLPLLAGVLSHCRTLVTNDSGAMHLAAAVGLPVTALFGPTRDAETRPLGPQHAVLTFPVWCRPCMLRECPLDHRCLRGIDVETVVSSVRRTSPTLVNH